MAAPARWGILSLAIIGLLLVAAPEAEEQRGAAPPPPERSPLPRARTSEEAAYYLKLAEYRRARKAFEREAGAYWDLIAEKRTLRRKKRAEGHAIGLDHYVLDQPPVYRGPREPVMPASLRKQRPPKPA